jgi:hypothetical protein
VTADEEAAGRVCPSMSVLAEPRVWVHSRRPAGAATRAELQPAIEQVDAPSL